MILLTYYTIFFILGTILGSFSSVLIERWHSGKGGIMTGRSECPNCKKVLGFFELFPLFSYIFQGGKCAGCKSHISLFYPLLEFSMGMIFLCTSYALYKMGYLWEDAEFWVVIFYAWITGVYIFYDIKYREIPDQILVPGIYISLAFLIGSYYFESFQVFFDRDTYLTYGAFFSDHIFGAITLYSFFYFQILIPGGYYLIRNRDFKNLGLLLFSYFTLPFTMLVDLFSQKHDDTKELEIPTWIGGGDLRIALFIGLTLGSIHGLFAFSFAYIFGSIVGVSLLIFAHTRGKTRQKEIAFGPFLGLGWLLSLTFHTEILYIIDNI